MFKTRVTITWWYNNNQIVCTCSSCAGKSEVVVLHDVLATLFADNWQWHSIKLTSRHINHAYGTIELQRGAHQYLTLQVFPA